MLSIGKDNCSLNAFDRRTAEFVKKEGTRKRSIVFVIDAQASWRCRMRRDVGLFWVAYSRSFLV